MKIWDDEYMAFILLFPFDVINERSLRVNQFIYGEISKWLEVS